MLMDPQTLNGQIMRGTPLWRVSEAVRTAPPGAMALEVYAGDVFDVLTWVGDVPGNKLVSDLTAKTGDDPSRLMRVKPADLGELVRLASAK